MDQTLSRKSVEVDVSGGTKSYVTVVCYGRHTCITFDQVSSCLRAPCVTLTFDQFIHVGLGHFVVLFLDVVERRPCHFVNDMLSFLYNLIVASEEALEITQVTVIKVGQDLIKTWFWHIKASEKDVILQVFKNTEERGFVSIYRGALNSIK